jgi:hypothetical protein
VWGIYSSEGWDSNKIIEYIDNALALGYEDAKAHYLRSSAHFANYNDGLALYDINLAVSLIRDDTKLMVDCLNLRVGILKSMRKYAECYDDLTKILQITPDNVNDSLLADIHHLTDDVIQRIGLQWKFGYSKREVGIYKFIVNLLILEDGAPKFWQLQDGSIKEYTRGMQVDKEFPYLVPVLREIVGAYIWEAAKRGEPYNATLAPKSNISN